MDWGDAPGFSVAAGVVVEGSPDAVVCCGASVAAVADVGAAAVVGWPASPGVGVGLGTGARPDEAVPVEG